jgi:WD40 repeat protein
MYKKKFEIKEHSGAVFSLTKDENYIYSASADKFVTRWNPNSGEQDSFAIKCESSIYKINHFQNKEILVVGTSLGDIHIIDTEIKAEIKFIKYHKVAIFEIQFDELDNKMYVGDADGNFSVWNTIDWSLLLNLPFECGKIRSILVLKEFNKLIFGAQDGKIRVLNKTNFNQEFVFDAHVNGCLTLFYSEFKKNVLFSAGKDGNIKAWRIDNFKEVFTFPAHKESIYKLVVINNKLISISRDKTTKLWDTSNLDFLFKLDRRFGGHSHSVNDILVFDTNIITASDDKRIIFWQPI